MLNQRAAGDMTLAMQINFKWRWATSAHINIQTLCRTERESQARNSLKCLPHLQQEAAARLKLTWPFFWALSVDKPHLEAMAGLQAGKIGLWATYTGLLISEKGQPDTKVFFFLVFLPIVTFFAPLCENFHENRFKIVTSGHINLLSIPRFFRIDRLSFQRVPLKFQAKGTRRPSRIF